MNLQEDAIKNALAKFGLECLMELREECANLNGEWLQEKAIECGLLYCVPVDEPCGEQCRCAAWDDFPQECVRFVPEFLALVEEKGEGGNEGKR